MEVPLRCCIPFIVALIALLTASVSSSQEIQILNAERRIDLTSHVVRVYLTLKVENVGAKPTTEILLAFPPTEEIAIVKAQAVSGKKKQKSYTHLDVKLNELADGPNGAKYYTVSLITPLKSGGSESTTIEVLYVVAHSLEPFPAEISQSEPQLVYYRDSAFLLSPYHIKKQTTFVKTPSKRVESFTKVEPSSRSGVELVYGPYEDRPPYSFSPVLVHFENNNPFAVVEELEREIIISHWGSVQITERYKLAHGGARHKGIFSRPSASGVSSFKNLLLRLPPRVHSVYYRDEIGNISSSHLRTDRRKSELEIEPRYPLFGGWTATFVVGYGLTLQDFLFLSPDGRRYLNFTFGCPLQQTIVNKLTIKVVLPEGSKDPSAVIPFPVEQQQEKKYTYLDIIGRITVVLRKKNVVPEHNIPFQIYYSFKPAVMLAEPLMLCSVFFLFFLGCITFLHVDLSLKKMKRA